MGREQGAGWQVLGWPVPGHGCRERPAGPCGDRFSPCRRDIENQSEAQADESQRHDEFERGRRAQSPSPGLKHHVNTNTCPPKGSCWSLVWTAALSPVKPRRRSVTPGRDPDLRARRERDHPSKHSSTTRSEAGSAAPSMRNRPLGSCSWIVPGGTADASGRCCRQLRSQLYARSRIRDRHWHQSGCASIATQHAALIQPAPTEYLVGVHSMRSGHASYRRARRQRLFNDPPPFLDRTPSASRCLCRCGLAVHSGQTAHHPPAEHAVFRIKGAPVWVYSPDGQGRTLKRIATPGEVR